LADVFPLAQRTDLPPYVSGDGLQDERLDALLLSLVDEAETPQVSHRLLDGLEDAASLSVLRSHRGESVSPGGTVVNEA
jgi:hypothetical protein